MKLVVTGKYEKEYNRNIVVLEGLKKNEVELLDFHYTKKKELDQKKFKEACQDCTAIYLPSFTHADVAFIRKLSNKPIVFDPLISRYLTKVFDYKDVFRYSPRALKNYFKDRIAFQKADLILADTASHKTYFSETFKIPESKFEVLPVGYPSSYFYPIQQAPHPAKKIGFYGSFAPLQGIDKIIDAIYLMKEVKNVSFHIIGTGFDYEKVQQKVAAYQLQHIQFEGWVAYEELNKRINQFDICLGIFGDSKKTDLVIPNKIFHYMACKKPVITKDTPAIRELFRHQEDVILCENSPVEIKNAIIQLLDQQALRNAIAEKGWAKISTYYNEYEIGKQLKQLIVKKLSDFGF